MQDVPTNFDTDLFMPIIKQIELLSNYKYVVDNYFNPNPKQTKINKHFKIIADHMRAVVNAINDGAKPSNVARGYIIRRLIRRAYRSGIQLGIKNKTFLSTLVKVVIDSLIFEINESIVSKIIKDEEFVFAKTVQDGEKLLNNEINKNNTVTLSFAFKLFETYGFPIELTKEILQEKNIVLDISGFDKLQKEHAEKSKSLKEAAIGKQIKSLMFVNKNISTFIGYTDLECKTKIAYLLNEGESVSEINGHGYFISRQTPFYATSGGQRHDKGYVIQGNNKVNVINVFKDKHNNHVHVFDGRLNSKEEIQLIVDPKIRINLERNHSATHLMFCALRSVFGNHIKQLGSDNNEERLTFDFPNETKPTPEEVRKIENLFNGYIQKAVNREYILTNIVGAEKMGAIMTLEEQEYMDVNNIRIVCFKNITSDLCGGTHIDNSANIEAFKIINVENKGSGIYRIKAITSHEKVNQYLENKIQKKIIFLNNLILKTKEYSKEYTLNFVASNNLEKDLQNLGKLIDKVRIDTKNFKKEKSNVKLDFNEKMITIINDNKYYIDLEVTNAAILKSQAAELRESHPNIIFILGFKNKDKLLIAIATKKNDTGKIFTLLVKKFNGKGGGNVIFSQGMMDAFSLEELRKVLSNA
jgi:alanyl-tRNA synthetase